MSNELKQIPCHFEILDQDDNSRFFKGKIRVQHDKENLNGSYFDLEDIKRCAEKTLRMTPILGSVVYDEELGDYRLNGHDMEMEIIEDEDVFNVSCKHIERIYGVVPHDAEISYEYDEEKDKTYLVTYGILWKDYLDEVEGIIAKKNNSTDVSMEINVHRYSFNDTDDLMHIHDYDFKGITLIGLPPGMEGANMQFSANVQNDMDELIKIYNQEKEEVELEEQVQVEETPVSDFEEAEVEIVNEETETTTDSSEEVVMEEAVDESSVEEVEAAAETEVEGSEDAADFESLYNELKTEYEALENKYSEAIAKLDEMSDYQELKEFKDKFDRAEYEKQVEEICSMFEINEDKIAPFKEQALNYELELEQLKKELALIYAMEIKNAEKQVEKTNTEKTNKVFAQKESYKPYGNLF